MTNVNDVIAAVQDQLRTAGIESAVAEAAIIVSHVLEISRGKLGVMQALGERLDDESVAAIQHLTQARAGRTPLQHVTGETTFYGVDLTMRPGVFIPRLETEVLVEHTLEQLVSTSPDEVKILDLCTGSGAIAAALADQLARENIATSLWAVDLDPQAVELAEHNTRDYNVTVLCADATDPASMMTADPNLSTQIGSFNAVVANPPYIPTDTPVEQTEAQQDPHLALYGGSADGMAIPLGIADTAATWLAPGGYFIMEHDHTHAAELAAQLAQNTQWLQVRTVADLTEAPRFVSAIRA